MDKPDAAADGSGPDLGGDHLLEPLLRWSATEPGHPLAARRVGDRFVDRSAAQIWSDVRALAKGLIGRGVGVGDRVAIMAESSLDWFELDHAIMAVGAITVPIYETSSVQQISWIVSDSESRLVLCGSDELAGLVAQAVEGVDRIVMDKPGLEALVQSGASIDDAEVDRRVAALQAHDVATIIYTSGTTGMPKGCVLTHANLRANIRQITDALGTTIGATDTALLFLPLAHVLSKMTALYCADRGARIAFGTGVPHLLEELSLAQPTVISAVPRIFEKVYAKAQNSAESKRMGAVFERAAQVAVRYSRDSRAGRVGLGVRLEHALYDRLLYRKIATVFGGRLRMSFSGGAPLGERLTSFFDGIGLCIYEGYGLTETSPIVTINRTDAWQPGSVGLPVIDTEVRRADDGELLVKGPQVFSGYWRNQSATDAVFDADGFFRTGDIGEFDAAGFLRITGRSKDLIVTAAGKNVAPAPLEDLLRPHALISQAMVIGDARPFISALITIDEDGLREWAEHHKLGSTSVRDLVGSTELQAEIQRAVDHANTSVSKAESIRKFTILARDFSVESGELTPTLKVKRAVVVTNHTEVIESLYS